MKQDVASRANTERFNAIASTFDDNPTRVELAHGVASAILEAVPIDGTTRAMELGCGTGLVTALLAPRLRHVLAVDGSAKMLEALGRKASELGILNIEPMESDLAQELPPGPFDLIYSSMTLHHIDDVAALFRRAYQRLAPAGRVAFADLALEDGTFHAAGVPGVMHHGFEAATLRGWLEAAGFVDVQGRIAHVVRKTRADGSMREYPVLLVTAQASST
ncbi:MAG: class I SAM-dependent DNA methyltransferase, partial [Rudaea sp.]